MRYFRKSTLRIENSQARKFVQQSTALIALGIPGHGQGTGGSWHWSRRIAGLSHLNGAQDFQQVAYSIRRSAHKLLNEAERKIVSKRSLKG